MKIRLLLALVAVSALAPPRHSRGRAPIAPPRPDASPWAAARARGAAALAGLLVAAAPLAGAPARAAAKTDTAAIGRCVLTECQLPLARCVASPKCLANLVCINTCSNRPDETECQIKCGDLFENDVATEFNACAVSQKKCVPQRADDGAYPVPPPLSLIHI